MGIACGLPYERVYENQVEPGAFLENWLLPSRQCGAGHLLGCIASHDPFHTCKLGCFRDFLGSTIMLLIKWSYFEEHGDLSLKLGRAHGHFALFCSTQKLSPALRSFTKNLFVYKSARSFPWMNVKGSDAMILLKWVVTLLVGCQADIRDPSHAFPLSVMLATGRAALAFFDLLYTHSMFLPRPCGALVYEKGTAFLTGYCILAQHCFSISFCGYAVKPKAHFLKHILVEMKLQLDSFSPYIMNPETWNCEMNEDHIGRLCRLSRRLDSRVMPKRVLQCFLIKGALLLKRFKATHHL